MNILVIGFQERCAEVEAYLDFLSTMDAQAKNGRPRFHGAETPITTDQQRILYSTVYLQLYNLVEATMSLCIQAVTDVARERGRWKPSDLSESLRREWVRAVARTHESLTPEHRLDNALRLCDHLVSALPIDAFDIDRGGGGSWDDSKIESISKRLGLQLVVSQPVYSSIKQKFRDDFGPLGLVKDLRNRLAHGSISFVQCSENESVATLIDLKDKTVNYLGEVVHCFSSCIESFEYLVPERRPA